MNQNPAPTPTTQGSNLPAPTAGSSIRRAKPTPPAAAVPPVKQPAATPPPPPPQPATTASNGASPAPSHALHPVMQANNSDGRGGVADILHASGALSDGQYDEVRVAMANSGKSAVDVIAEKGYVPDEALVKARAQYLNVPYVDLAQIGVSAEGLNLVQEPVARRYKLLPFGLDKENNTLSVAMTNPLDLNAIDFVEKKTGKRLIPHLTTEQGLQFALDEHYSQGLSTEVSAALKEDPGAEREKRVISVEQLGEVIREAPIAKIVETILTFALKTRASDVHIEPQENMTRVRYRIDGLLHEKLVLPVRVHGAVVSRIKILARMKIDERRRPQDGRFSFSVGEDEVDLRVSSLPTVHGEKIVMRLLQKSGKVPTLDGLGLRGTALKSLQEAIVVPHGIILITGPTGSGKTTTLYSILNKINTPKVNIVTLEDPVEYEIPGVNQVQVNTQAKLTFASGLRSFLRQDPNIIMVGEVRDKETAELAIQASLTGHLVFSTLHTNSAAGALPRLLDMEAEPFLLASSMTCVVAQRVGRKVCEHCKESYTPPPKVLKDIKDSLQELLTGWLKQKGITENAIVLYRGVGCTECNNTGYSGRIGIFEVMPVSEHIGRLILERSPASVIEKQAVTDGMILMKQDGFFKALEGITSVEEVLRVAEV